jgi:hypothetical protein
METAQSILIKSWYNNLLKSKKLIKFRQYFDIQYQNCQIIILPRNNITKNYLTNLKKITIDTYKINLNNLKSFGKIYLRCYNSSNDISFNKEFKNLRKTKFFLEKITIKFPKYIKPPKYNKINFSNI